MSSVLQHEEPATTRGAIIQPSSPSSASNRAAPFASATPLAKPTSGIDYSQEDTSCKIQRAFSALGGYFSTAAAQCALNKCTSSAPKPPLPKYIAMVIDISHRRRDMATVAPTVEGQNAWLVDQLKQRIQEAPDGRIMTKIMMLTHDLLVYGAPEFAQMLEPIADSMFNADAFFIRARQNMPKECAALPSYSGIRGDPNVYENGLRFFIAYVHAVHQFQMRHRRADGNLLDVHAEVTTDPEVPSDWYRDLVVSAATLIKVIVTTNTVFPHYCFVFAEIVRRYVADSKVLYHVMLRTMHALVVSRRNCSLTPLDEVRANMNCFKQFARITDQLNIFYDALRELPDEATFEKELIPPTLRQLPQGMQDHWEQRWKRMYEVEKQKPESLASVLSHKKQDDVPISESGSPQQSQGASVASSDSFDSFVTAQSFFMEGTNGERADIVLHNRTVVDTSRFDEESDDLFAVAAAAAEQQAAYISNLSNLESSRNSTDSAKLSSLTAPSSIMITSTGESTTDTSRFEVLSQVLGKGGFGVVYKAWDEVEGRHVACKEVKLSHDKAALHELFKEYRVLTTLEHPNIVRVLGFVVHAGNGRIFMEWVPSGSVQAVLQDMKRGLREPIVRRYMREALEGLAFLHSRGIVHRDIKPGNMLLSSEGAVKLTDFGTSRTLERAVDTMQTGTVVGTVPYLAPECVRGTYSAASDVWAMGCTALHMVTGRAPWADEARDNVSLIFKLGSMTEGKHLPKILNDAEVSCELGALIKSAMTFDRHQRPSAEELLSHPFFAA